jgi:hypothetical protein
MPLNLPEVENLINEFESICIDLATFARSGEESFQIYQSLRLELLSHPALQRTVPYWVIENRYGGQFWYFISSQFQTYAERREFIWSEIAEIRNFAQSGANNPIARSVVQTLSSYDSTIVEQQWIKIQNRRDNDLEGAITASKAMVETILKHILEEVGLEYTNNNDLPGLYSKVAHNLNVSPDGSHEPSFRQVLQGLVSVVNGIASIRNIYGDSHGKGSKYIPPEKMHTNLMIHCAGTISVFLIEMHKNGGGGKYVTFKNNK